jgi:hypothetical protein
MRVNRIGDSMLPAIDDYTAPIYAESPDFAAIEEPLKSVWRAAHAMTSP